MASEPAAATISDGAELGTVDAGLLPWQTGFRSRWAVITIILAVAYVLLWAVVPMSPILLAIAIAVMVITPIRVLSYDPIGYYQARLSRRYPDARIVATQTGIWLRDLVEKLLPGSERSASLARRTAWLVFEPDRLSFWSRRGLELDAFLTVPRERIVSISKGSNPRAAFRDSYVVIRIRDENDETYVLSFTPQAPRLRGYGRDLDWAHAIVKWLIEEY